MEIEADLAARILGPSDILGMDNTANHSGIGNTVLEE